MTIEDQLVRDEGCRLFPYVDSVGKTTIGVGRNLTDAGISLAEAKILLEGDIATATTFLNQNLPWTLDLDDARKGSFINLAFNMQHRLLTFHDMLAAAKSGNWSEVSAQLLNSEWANQVGARAQRIAKQLETGEWI